jgi:S1-C subfamily serine protease
MRATRNILVLYITFVLLLAWYSWPSGIPYAHLQNITVKVESGNAMGTGVIVTRQVGDVTRSYVWTAGHVVENMLRADGTFSQVAVSWEVRENGQFVEEVKIPAKVIAYSGPDGGEDLALLEILQDNLCTLNVSANFIPSDGIPAIGTELVHVGCTVGLYNSVSLGIVSQTDRTLDEEWGVFDQTSVMGYPGSSGGGVYLTDGRCIGLLTRGAGAGLNFVVPVRRISEWAMDTDILWALDPSIPVPLVRASTELEQQ